MDKDIENRIEARSGSSGSEEDFLLFEFDESDWNSKEGCFSDEGTLTTKDELCFVHMQRSIATPEPKFIEKKDVVLKERDENVKKLEFGTRNYLKKIIRISDEQENKYAIDFIVALNMKRSLMFRTKAVTSNLDTISEHPVTSYKSSSSFHF